MVDEWVNKLQERSLQKRENIVQTLRKSEEENKLHPPPQTYN